MCGADPDPAHFDPYLASLFDAEVSQHDGNPEPQRKKKKE
jgi:hypothetical protein